MRNFSLSSLYTAKNHIIHLIFTPPNSIISGEKYRFGANKYRYGFNGKEKDDEFNGDGNSYDFGARVLDVRLGRWLSIDPYAIKYLFASPYNFALNSPLQFYDPDGRLVRPVNANSFEKLQSALVETVGASTPLGLVFSNMQMNVIGTIDGNPVEGIDVSTLPTEAAFKKLLKDDNAMSTDQKLACLAWYKAMTDDEVVIEIAVFAGEGEELNANSGAGTSAKVGDDGIPISNSPEFMEYVSDVRGISADNTISEADAKSQTLEAQDALLSCAESKYLPNQGKIKIEGSCTPTPTGESCSYAGTNSKLATKDRGQLPVVGILFSKPTDNFRASIANIMVNEVGRDIKLVTISPGTKKDTKTVTTDSLKGDGTTNSQTEVKKK